MSGHLTAIGLISGTSADGVDAVLLQTDGTTQLKTRAFLTQPYPPELRERVLNLYEVGENELDRLGKLDRDLGEVFSQAVFALCQQAGIQPLEVHVIGSHGQTIRHRPPIFSKQIGSPAIICARTGITTIGDFRAADLAMGGDGAPLLPLFHQMFLGVPGKRVAVVNLGGIANITALPANSEELVIAGDTGPANSLLDFLTETMTNGKEHFDRDGRRAAAGNCDMAALEWLLQHPYLAKPFPKSTGREEFGRAFVDEYRSRFQLNELDYFATLAQFTAQSIVNAAIQLLPPYPERLVLCGGGIHNPQIEARIAPWLLETEIMNSDELGIQPDSMEAQAFAWFAVRTLRGLPSSLPNATRAKQPATLGSIHPGRNWASLLKKLNLDAQRPKTFTSFRRPPV